VAIFSREAVLEWAGDVSSGAGTVSARSSGFAVAATYPRIAGEPPGHTTPEEMLAASHAICYGIGLRGLIAQRGGKARRVRVTATITAEKTANGIRIKSSHLHGLVEGLEGIDPGQLEEIGKETKERCTISIAIGGSVPITFALSAVAELERSL
jgi:lipoyl-dependent peroxiredoxin